MSQRVQGLNVCVLAGEVHRAPQWRLLASGGSVTAFDVKVRSAGSRADVLRVSWLDAPASAMELSEGDEVVVCGTLRSYWAGRSVTDMSCTSVVSARATAKIRRCLGEAMATLQEACP